MQPGFIGRRRQLSQLREVLSGETDIAGVVLVAGEAGIGKSRLVREAVRDIQRPVLYGLARAETATPYAQIVDILRAYLRDHAETLSFSPLIEHVRLLLPELGPTPSDTDPATLSEAICGVLRAAGASGSILVLEDLQWADAATLELLTKLPTVQEQCGLGVLGTYRNDEISRLHRLRGVRSELRRSGHLMELTLDPLSREETKQLVSELRDSSLGEGVINAIHERTNGIPFFVEELVAVAGEDAGSSDERMMEALPETVTDAIRMRVAPLDPAEQEVLQLMAAAGATVDLALLSDIADADSLMSLTEHGWLIRIEGGTALFRHQLVRDAVYADIPWGRRRELHRFLARALEERSAPPDKIGHHWLQANDPVQARPHLLRGARSFSSVHAYQDAHTVLRAALETWDDAAGDRDRIEALELLASCVELSGDPDEALRLWRDVARRRSGVDDPGGRARAERRIATLLEIRGEAGQAVAARISAAEGFAQSAQPEEAAAERLAAAAHLQSEGHLAEALRLVQAAASDADVSASHHLRVGLLALEGQVRTKMGELGGVDLVRDALTLALSEDIAEPVVDAYYRLGDALEYALRYTESLDVMETAAAFCRARGMGSMNEVCYACTTPAMRHIGRWKEAVVTCRRVLDDPEVGPVAHNVSAVELGLIELLKGSVEPARRLIAPVLSFAEANGIFGLVVESCWGRAMIHAHDGRSDEASATANDLVERCRKREEWHYSLTPMRWSSTWFAERGDEASLAGVVDTLSAAASRMGSPEANAALAFGFAEVAYLQGDVARAVVQAQRVLNLLDEIAAVYEVAEMRARCAIMLAEGGHRDRAIGALVASYRTAKKLGARPLLGRVVTQFDVLGEPIEPHLGIRATAGSDRAGLTRRELEVLRYVAAGRTNKEIAQALFLSPRTVDMHVRNILSKLGCRSRAEASRRAAELGLLEGAAPQNPA